MSLNSVGLKFGTDKASSHHNYLALYELLFANIDSKPEQQILEIGIQFGYSLQTWKEYFEYPIITGIDSVDNGVKIDRVEIIIGDAYSHDMLSKLEDREFDIIIDDGDHLRYNQAFVVLNYSQLLIREGLLIIEDVNSLEAAEHLKESVPEGFNWAVIDMRGVPDNILFLVYRK